MSYSSFKGKKSALLGKCLLITPSAFSVKASENAGEFFLFALYLEEGLLIWARRPLDAETSQFFHLALNAEAEAEDLLVQLLNSLANLPKLVLSPGEFEKVLVHLLLASK